MVQATTTPKAQADAEALSVQMQMVNDLLSYAKVDPYSVANKEAAVQSWQEVTSVSMLEKSAERRAMMDRLNLDASQYEQAFTLVQDKAQNLGSQAQVINSEEQSLLTKLSKKRSLNVTISALSMVGLSVGLYKFTASREVTKDNGTMKIVSGLAGALLGFFGGGSIASRFTVKPVENQLANLETDKIKLNDEMIDLSDRANQFQYEAMREMAARLLQEKVGKGQGQQPVIENHQKVTPQQEVTTPSAVQKVMQERAALAQASARERVEESQQSAQDASIGVG